MGNSKHNPYSASLGNKLPTTFFLWHPCGSPTAFSTGTVPPARCWQCRHSSPDGVNRRAKNQEECREPDSVPTSTCQLDQMAIDLIQGPLKSRQIFVLISVALDQHLCTQMKVSFFFPKGDKVIFSFHREKGSADAIFPALPLGQSI